MVYNQGNSDNIQSQLFIYNCTLCASFVILYYDYLLTCQDEYDRYWTSARKFTLGWTLFFINRYVVILGNIPVIFLYFWSWSESDRLEMCLNVNHYHEFLIVASQVVIGSIVIVRTHAIYGRSRRVLFVLVAVTIGATAYGMHSILLAKSDAYSVSDLTSSGCLLPISGNGSHGLAEAWIGHLFFDTLVFVLTLYKSLMAKRAGFSILTIMLRDGTVYFGVMVLASISVILSFEVFPDYLRGMTSTLTNILSSTMMSRLMLNLRDPHLDSKNDKGEIVLSKLVFESGPHASINASKNSLSDEEWGSPVDIDSPDGIYILETDAHPGRDSDFSSVMVDKQSLGEIV